MNTIVKRPLITEKSLTLASTGWYTFMVTEQAEKEDIAKVIAKFYSVTVTEVRTVHMHGKMRRVGRMQKYAKKADWKKAIVHLKKGDKIDAFEVTEQAAPQGKSPAPTAK